MKPPPGLFITGTGTGVGKTFVTACIAAQLHAAGKRVGVYKPAESGVEGENSGDAFRLWQAAGRPGELKRVCPQRFAAPLAPHLAARAAGTEIDVAELRAGVAYWREQSDIVLVEGAGGLMSPISDDEYVADLAFEFAYPLLVVAENSLGVINQTLQTLITASTFRDGLSVAGVVLNNLREPDPRLDPSVTSNRRELASRCVPPVLAELAHGGQLFDADVDWFGLAAR